MGSEHILKPGMNMFAKSLPNKARDQITRNSQVGQEVNNDPWPGPYPWQQGAPSKLCYDVAAFSDESNMSCRCMQLVSENPGMPNKSWATSTECMAVFSCVKKVL
jgi:hypothetical protein